MHYISPGKLVPPQGGGSPGPLSGLRRPLSLPSSLVFAPLANLQILQIYLDVWHAMLLHY